MVGSNVYDDGYYGYYNSSYYHDSDCSNVVDVSCGDAPTTLPTTTPHPTSIETYCEEFTVTMEDSYGDGWNGAVAQFFNSGSLIGELAVVGTTGSITLSVSADVAGCTDAAADNYNPAATVDDGSCCLDNTMTINLYDSFGDGWTWAGDFGGVVIDGFFVFK